MQARILGAIDVGSNSIRLMVARVADHRAEVLATRRITTRMILGVVDGFLTGEAIERNAQAVASLAREARAKGAEEVLAFGTSAMRDAKNRDALIERTREVCGVTIQVLSGEEEAQMAYGGCAPEGECGVIDIGGGSSEVLCGRDGQVRFAASAQVGAVRLMNRLAGDDSDPVRLIEAAREVVHPVAAPAREMGERKWMGVGGTITTLAAMTWGVSKYTPDAIENCPITREGARAWLDRLCSLTIEQRKAIPGLPAHRADAITFGAAILCAVLDEVGAQVVYATDHDNLEGRLSRVGSADCH